MPLKDTKKVPNTNSSFKSTNTLINSIQKASNPWQVNKVYQEHTKNMDESVQQQYLPVVLRVFTRLIHQDMNVLQYISSFIKKEQPRITSISIRSMDIEQVKDILLFFYKFTKFHPVVHPSL